MPARIRDGRRYARFNPLSPADLALFRVVLAGEHVISGFRNADLSARLYKRPPLDSAEAHRRCERVSRLITKLRGHGLIAKVPPARLYRPTRYGYHVLAAAIALHDERYPAAYLAAEQRLACLLGHKSCAPIRYCRLGTALTSDAVKDRRHPVITAGSVA